jgi:hypothetical protein
MPLRDASSPRTVLRERACTARTQEVGQTVCARGCAARRRLDALERRTMAGSG